MNNKPGIEQENNIKDKLDGLSTKQAEELLAIHGENSLPSEKGPSKLAIFLGQLKSPLVYIILAAAAVSLVVREYGDFGIIMAVVVFDAILGYIQEYRAQQTYQALKSLIKPVATVLRNGTRMDIEAKYLVPGDIVILNAGEHVPADGAVLESTKLTLDEAILTGESEPVQKSETTEENSLFMGTTVIGGRAFMQVTGTGLETELGKIARSLSESVEEKTPLQVRLEAFSKTLTRIVVVFTLAILAVGLILGNPFFEMLRTSIILAIAAVPEGLLIAVTVILVLGMRKILRRNGLVKKMQAVETLGSVNVICTDKTGTLTEGKMRVTRTDFLDKAHSLETMTLCNNLEGPVDLALWDYAGKQEGVHPQDWADGSERLAEELFTSESKFMVTETRFKGDHHFYLKGAPEIVLDMCSLESSAKTKILGQIDSWAGEGLRLIGLAYRTGGNLADRNGFTWLGLIGLEDPIREGVVDSIRLAHHAGIDVKMITGDYRVTAERIARNIGLMGRDDTVLEGSELQGMDDDALRKNVEHIGVFARIRPEDKLRIVRALQAKGQVAAMVGDGVNDAPALKKANIGVVVGSATDVAKETADLILMDDNFKTIVAAIEEGRIIFENIRKVVAYTLSNSFAEVLTIFIAMILGWPAPLAVAQILWIHLICDGPSDIVLGFEPSEAGIMDEKPKSVKEPVLPPLAFSLIAVISISSAIAALSLFGHFFQVHMNPVEGRSIVFASFAVNSMVYIFAYRSMRLPLYRMSPLSANKPLIWAVLAGLFMAVFPFLVPELRRLLVIVPLSIQEWLLVAGIALALLVIVEIGKAVNNKLHPAG